VCNLPWWQAFPAAREPWDECLSDGDFGDPQNTFT
jgi:hypothetical protein